MGYTATVVSRQVELFDLSLVVDVLGVTAAGRVTIHKQGAEFRAAAADEIECLAPCLKHSVT